MKKIIFVLVMGVITLGLNLAFAEDEIPEALIAKVDTVMFQVNKPRELFRLFNDTFQLPVAWEYSDFDGYSSGGVKCGNVNLESLSLGSVPSSVNGMTGIAFEPGVENKRLLKVLDKRGIEYIQHDLGALYSTELLNILPGTMVHLVEYKSYAALFMKNGPLPENPAGIEYAQELIIGVNDFAGSRKNWQAMLNPISEISPGQWQPERGPKIHLIQSESNGILALKLKVKSLAQTEKFLKEAGLFGRKESGSVKTDPEKTLGVIFEFVG
ncbi:MAG TPA: hypothetical protein VHR47_01740 [Bacillota bacterium]|nr:hypothetical protein [Bacillota bacterium]